MREFGDVLKEIRESRSLSQEELANILDTSKQVISRYETGQRIPKISVVAEYAKVLKVDPRYLIGLETTDNVHKLDPDQSIRLSEARDDTIETKALDSRLRSIETAYASLNDEGRQRLVQYADDLAGMEKYKRTDAPIKTVRSKKKTVRLPMAGVGEGGSSVVVKVDDEEEFNRKIEAAAKKAEERAYMDSHYSEIFGQKDGEDDN